MLQHFYDVLQWLIKLRAKENISNSFFQTSGSLIQYITLQPMQESDKSKGVQKVQVGT
jgi:hypothetical protein